MSELDFVHATETEMAQAEGQGARMDGGLRSTDGALSTPPRQGKGGVRGRGGEMGEGGDGTGGRQYIDAEPVPEAAASLSEAQRRGP